MKYKILALVLYLSCLSMNMTAEIAGVSTRTVMRWIHFFHDKYVENQPSEGRVEKIEVDEMASYIGKKDQIWIWKVIIIEKLSSGGSAVIVAPKP